MIETSLWTGPEPSAAVDACRVEFELDGKRLELDAVDVSELPFERATAVREFPAWRGKRHYSGSLWMEGVRGHVAFESLAERLCLIELDRDPRVTGVASQPMWIRWGDGSPREHAPDYFVRLSDGTGALIDVRPRERIDDAARVQFDRTAIFCRIQGWRYAVYAPDSPIRDANLRFLLRYREPRWRSAEITARAAGFRGALGALADVIDDGDRAEAFGRAYALMWSGQIIADLEQPLSPRSAVTWRGEL
ncbi:TnsA-like heteromeric transposase endonuclease subunit [Microbacterium paludicola]|jgi:hypothetical protein|uniref:TnsA-like heteromeric transposase endonuclease subunit n=1 Tax=Microbacterium paludicola TaxID=300019 RepID=A0A4Y9FUS1_9MICO|nr:TnsA-like heteromeric transposase endonuclease subunit [Microbacterium paludicola]MBF0816255.1 TnsA-like heteromeric transposase endonuclease subunit [Microbacterium paludicola]TFU33058.1 TnsA-like heteromeric transposase endonuclease subunit [Microbacterium paludicola]